MTIGVLTIWLEIAGSNSLKDKRQSLKSLLDLLRNKFNVSAAEVGDNDTWRRAVVGVACVSNDQAHAGAVLNDCRVTGAHVLLDRRDGRGDPPLARYRLFGYGNSHAVFPKNVLPANSL